MSEWLPQNIGTLIKLITKGTTPNKAVGGFSEAGINYIKSESISYDGQIDTSKFAFISEDVHKELKRSQLQQDDILFSMAGAYLGKSAIVKEEHLPANTNQALAIIRLDQSKANPKFINYFFRHPNVIDYVNNLSGQSAQPNINFEEIKSIEVRLPPLPEQKAIASVLSSLDDKIDLLHRQNKTLEAMAETLFRQWFIEEAKEDWEEKSLDAVVSHFIDYRGKTPNKTTSGIPLITAKIVKAGRIQEPTEFISDEDYPLWMTRGYPEINDVVLTTEAPLGEIGLIRDTNVALAQRIITMRCDSNIFDNVLLKYYLMSEVGQYELDSRASGTTVFGIKASVLKKLSLLIPPLDEQKTIAEQLHKIEDKIYANEKQVRSLSKLRDTLLPKLMNGEVRVQYQTEQVA